VEPQHQRLNRRRYRYEEVDHMWLVRWLADAARYYADNGDEEQYVYRIKIENSHRIATALYIPGARRLGIDSGGDIAWASEIIDVNAAIDAYVQEPEAWGELPHIQLPWRIST